LAKERVHLSGMQKAAILIVALGVEASAKVFSELREEEIEEITVEIARLKDISPQVRESVINEFYQMARAREYISEGGLDYARQILEATVGQEKAREVVLKVQGSIASLGFELLRDVDAQQLRNIIRNEHPQTIALILASLRTQKAAEVLAALPTEVQPDVVGRMATLEHISSEMVAEIEQALSGMVSTVVSPETEVRGGLKRVAEILNVADRATEKNVLGKLDKSNSELATQIKNLMFVFEDIILLDDRSIQRLLKEIDTRDLALALKAASDELKERIFNNMSKRAADMVKEELDLMGPVRLKTIEEVQRRIVDTIRKLEEEGELLISGRGSKEEEIIV